MRIDPDWYATLLDSLYDGVYFLDRQRIIRYWNRGAERITGFKKEEVIGSSCRDNILMHIDHKGVCLCASNLCPALKTIGDGAHRDAEIFLHHKEGHRVPVVTRIAPITDESGEIIGAAEIFSDNRRMYEAKEKIRELEDLAMIDPVSGICNRHFGEKDVKRAFEDMKRSGGNLALLLIDLDHFKSLNDLHGRDTGDRVLRALAQTLRNGLRDSDIACRWGADEFMAATRNMKPALLDVLGQKILFLIQHCSVDTASGPLRFTASVGAALSRPEDACEDVIRRAQTLLLESKKKGWNRVTVDRGEATTTGNTRSGNP